MSRENLAVPFKLENIFYKLTVVNSVVVRREFWTLAGYVLSQILILDHL